MNECRDVEGEHLCARCAADAQWLVCVKYGVGVSGRLVPYCTECRNADLDSIVAFISLMLAYVDPETVLLGLYSSGVTFSDPDVFAARFWPELSQRWVNAARKRIAYWNTAVSDSTWVRPRQ